jgi:hypothetical protein
MSMKPSLGIGERKVTIAFAVTKSSGENVEIPV